MFLSFLVPFRSMVWGSSHPSVDILVLVPYSNHGTRTRMSTAESRTSNQQSSTRSRRGFSRRAGSIIRYRRGFSRRAKTRTRNRRGFSRRAKTRTRNRRVLLSPRSTALVRIIQKMFIPNPEIENSRQSRLMKKIRSIMDYKESSHTRKAFQLFKVENNFTYFLLVTIYKSPVSLNGSITQHGFKTGHTTLDSKSRSLISKLAEFLLGKVPRDASR